MRAFARYYPKEVEGMVFVEAVQAEMDWSPEDVENLYQNKGKPGYTLGDIPLIVLTRGSGGYSGRPDSLELEQERPGDQAALAKLSTNSKHIIDPNSGHNIHLEDPQLVIASIKEVLAAVREKRRSYKFPRLRLTPRSNALLSSGTNMNSTLRYLGGASVKLPNTVSV